MGGEAMTAKEKALFMWLWNRADVEPFDGISEMDGNMVVRKIWHCRGCEGEFTSKDFVPYVGYGADPTDETFPHEEGCFYLAAKEMAEDIARVKA
jgi:hypothetical protein